MDAGIVLAVAAAVIAAVAGLAVWYARWAESQARRRIDRILRRLEMEGRGRGVA